MPEVLGIGLEKIMHKHHHRKRKHRYKKIKKIIEGEGVNITTLEESSSFTRSEVELRSRYSNFISFLSSRHDDSMRLAEMCWAIDRGMPARKHEREFEVRGEFEQ